jgi:hypothetical protein
MSWSSGAEVVADDQGQFTLRKVPRSQVRLSVYGDALIEQNYPIVELDPREPLRLVVDRRCHFRLIPESGLEGVSHARVLDAEGRELQIFTFQNNGWSSSSRVSLDPKTATHALAVSERARSLVLESVDGDLRTLPMDLLPGSVTELRY